MLSKQNKKKNSNNSDNRLALNRWQVIIWTNEGLVFSDPYIRHLASLNQYVYMYVQLNKAKCYIYKH